MSDSKPAAKGPIDDLGLHRLAVLAAQQVLEDHNGQDFQCNNAEDQGRRILNTVPELSNAVQRALEDNPLPASLYHHIMDYLESVARHAASELTPGTRARLVAVVQDDNSAGQRLLHHAQANGLEIQIINTRGRYMAKVRDWPAIITEGLPFTLIAGHGRTQQEAVTDLAWLVSGQTLGSPFHKARLDMPGLTEPNPGGEPANN